MPNKIKNNIITIDNNNIMIIIIRLFCPRAGPPLQTQEPRPQFCTKAGLPPQTKEPRLQLY